MPVNVPWNALTAITLLMAACAMPVFALVMQPRQLDDPLDRTFMGLPATWALTAVVAWLGWTAAPVSGYSLWSALVYHALCVSATSFLLACAGLSRSVFGSAVALYALVGTIALLFNLDLYNPLAPVSSVVSTVWLVLTALIVTVSLIALLLKLRGDTHAHTALIVLAGWWGWSLMLGDLGTHALGRLQEQTPGAFELSAGHVFFFACLTALWLQFTGRMVWMRLPSSEAASHNSSGFASLSAFDMSTSFSSISQEQLQDSMLGAVAGERKRIAQDIHDGVGSQLVGLIASLDANSPVHRRVMLGLESCLLDLKTTVDNVDADDSDTNIFDALGRLRYRFQPSLARAGIRMQWKVDVAGPLISVRPAQLVHVVRIAQETLANVLVHSEAKNVRLTCRYEPQPVPRMLLEILDDGKGMAKRPVGDIMGKGLTGIRERARSIGALLQISTNPGVGTRVRLYLPLG